MVRASMVLVLTAAIAGQSSAQTQTLPGTTLNTTLLYPVSGGPTGNGQFPSGRFMLNYTLNPNMAVHAGALHLTPANAGMWAGVAGLSFEVLTGRLSASPFIDAGYGMATGLEEIGTVGTPSGPVPVYKESTEGAFGGGAGVLTEWMLSPFLTFSTTAGYWHFQPGGAIDPLSGPFLGGGLRFGLPFGDGVTTGPPVLAGGPIQIQIEEPVEWSTDGTRGIRAAAKNSIRVRGTARDPLGRPIAEVRLNGSAANMVALDGSGALTRFTGFVPVYENTNQVEVSVLAADGRRATGEYPITPTVPRVADEAAELASRSLAGGSDGKRFAVVIGISDYADETIPDLEFADDDATAFYDFLRSERAGLGGIPEENIQLLLNEEATYRNMRSALYTFLEQATDDDLVYIYIAAHGAPNPNRPDDLFILPFDAEANNIAGTGLAMGHVNEAIQKLYARHTVLLTDACHSGGIGAGSFATRAAPGDETLNAINRAFLQDLQATQSGLAILTASEARQLSREGEQWGGGHGVFTWYLLKGLEGEADEDGDSIVRLGELLEYVRDSVRRETNNGQIPAFGSNAFDRFMPVAIIPPKTDK